jgi:FAD/FMN-containing dehydrogenase
LIEVGPCVALKVLSKRLLDLNVTIPHGECPLVNVGGHAQTGGFGHIIHSFGLCLDYVQAFDIVLADGKLMNIVRP